MPREKPFRCKRCGGEYTGGRCPVCYPQKRRRRRANGGGRRGRAADVLGRGMAVSVDSLDQHEAEATAAEAMKGGDPDDEGTAGRSGQTQGGTIAGETLQPAQGAA